MSLFRIQPDRPWRNPHKHPRPIRVDSRLEHDLIAMDLLSGNAWFVSQMKHMPDLHVVARVFDCMIQVDFLPTQIEFKTRDINRPKGAHFSLFKLHYGKLVSIPSDVLDEREFPDRLQRTERDLDASELSRTIVHVLEGDTNQRSLSV